MQKQVRTMGRSNSSTRSGHRSFVTGCASNAMWVILLSGAGEVLVVLDGRPPLSPTARSRRRPGPPRPRARSCQMAATALAVPVEGIEVTVEGDLDLRGTLGVAKDVPAGFQAIRVTFDVHAPQATPEQLASLGEKTERYCTLFQTPPIRTEWQTP